MVLLCAKSKIRDNDPRMRQRVGQLVAFDTVKGRWQVLWEDSGVKTWVSEKRVFSDSKERKTGYSVVTQ